MDINELTQALKSLRLGGMAETLEMRILQAQTECMAPADFLASLVNDETMYVPGRAHIAAPSGLG